MILFHGTVEEHVKNIKKKGLLAATTDQWILEITNKKVCCFSKRPVSGEGGNPLFFARDKGQNGYIVVVDIPQDVLIRDKLIAILDNKVLDDYVQYHFFTRHEFRTVGYPLFCALREYKTKDSSFEKLAACLQKRPVQERDPILASAQEQREYYKDLRKHDQRHMFALAGLEFSHDLKDLVEFLGGWKVMWKFLTLHFENISPEIWQKFQTGAAALPNKDFWQSFYQTFKLCPSEPKFQIWQNWFSHRWLAERRQDQGRDQKERELWITGHRLGNVGKNCQILAGPMEPEFILGCIQVTTSSKVLPEFLYQKKSGIVQAIWDKVEIMLKNRRN